MRITISRDEAKTFFPLLVKKFAVATYLCAFEKPPNNPENEHIHCHLEMDNYKKSTMSDFMKKHNLTGKYYCKLVRKTKHDNLVYIVKNNDILFIENIEQSELDNALNETDRINDEKTIPMKHQLVNHWIKYNENELVIPDNKLALYMFIGEYHTERDYLPPTFSLCNQYALYIVMDIYRKLKSSKPYVSQNDKNDYYVIYAQLMNCKLDEIPTPETERGDQRHVNKSSQPIQYNTFGPIYTRKMKYEPEYMPKSYESDGFETEDDTEQPINYDCEFIN